MISEMKIISIKDWKKKKCTNLSERQQQNKEMETKEKRGEDYFTKYSI